MQLQVKKKIKKPNKKEKYKKEMIFNSQTEQKCRNSAFSLDFYFIFAIGLEFAEIRNIRIVCVSFLREQCSVKMHSKIINYVIFFLVIFYLVI